MHIDTIYICTIEYWINISFRWCNVSFQWCSWIVAMVVLCTSLYISICFVAVPGLRQVRLSLSIYIYIFLSLITSLYYFLSLLFSFPLSLSISISLSLSISFSQLIFVVALSCTVFEYVSHIQTTGWLYCDSNKFQFFYILHEYLLLCLLCNQNDK